MLQVVGYYIIYRFYIYYRKPRKILLKKKICIKKMLYYYYDIQFKKSLKGFIKFSKKQKHNLSLQYSNNFTNILESKLCIFLFNLNNKFKLCSNLIKILKIVMNWVVKFIIIQIRAIKYLNAEDVVMTSHLHLKC